jgi:hypothetical protein
MPTWFCGKGRLAEGVTGYALKHHRSPRPFIAGSLTWGGNTWTHHFELLHGVGSILERTDPETGLAPSGYALDRAWNVNPANAAADLRDKRADYLAALAVKTSTNRNGVRVSPYNFANRTGGVAPNPGELNQCEPGYQATPDVASTGAIENGILIHLVTNHWYQDPGANQQCKWAQDWGLAEGTVQATTAADGSACKVLVPDGAQTFMGLNLADTENRRCPTWVACPPGSRCPAVAITAGRSVAYALAPEGTVSWWGMGAPPGQSRSLVVAGTATPLAGIVEISRGVSTRGLAIDHARGVWQFSWDPATGANSGATRVLSAGAPFDRAIGVGTGTDHGCAVRMDGTVWCWGRNDQGQLGTGDPATGTTEPHRVLGVDGVASVHLLADATCVRKRDGTAWCWGARFLAMPVSIVTASLQPLTDIVALSGGSAHACALRADRTVWCWGYNAHGQLGDGTVLPQPPGGAGTGSRAVQVRLPGGAAFAGAVQISAGDHQTCARRADRTVHCWGRNDHGQLGDGQGGAISVGPWPRRVKLTTGAPASDVIDLAVGGEVGCLRRADGSPWCWGSNSKGEIGDGTTVDRIVATPSIAFEALAP